jgi:hypothetical protein
MKSPERMFASLSNGWADSFRGRVGLLLLLGTLALSSCATIPEKEPRELLSYLPESHNGYLSVAPSAEPYLSITLLQAFGFDEGDARRIAERTERAFLGLGPDEEFSLVALGRYPDRSIGRTLRREGWQELEVGPGETSWVHAMVPYRVIRLEKDLYAVTTGEALSYGGIRIPEPELRRFLRASMGFYAPEPGRALLGGMIGRGELPIRDVYVEFRPPRGDELREVTARVQTRSEEDARTLLVITRLLVVGTLNAGGIAFDEIPDSLTVERRGSEILLDGLFLREGQIARLFLQRMPPSQPGVLP